MTLHTEPIGSICLRRSRCPPAVMESTLAVGWIQQPVMPSGVCTELENRMAVIGREEKIDTNTVLRMHLNDVYNTSRVYKLMKHLFNPYTNKNVHFRRSYFCGYCFMISCTLVSMIKDFIDFLRQRSPRAGQKQLVENKSFAE